MDETELKLAREKAFATYGRICQRCGSEFQVFAVIRGDKKPLVLCEVCNQLRLDYQENRENETQLPFGKYEGKVISDCPSEYLHWLIKQDWLSNWLREKMTHHLEELSE